MIGLIDNDISDINSDGIAGSTRIIETPSLASKHPLLKSDIGTTPGSVSKSAILTRENTPRK